MSLTGDFPFINLMKTASNWEYNDNSGRPTATEFNPDGYPNTIVHSGVRCFANIFPQSARSGNYVLTWDGNGTMGLGVPNTGAITPVSGSLTSTTGSGRYVFTTTSPDALTIQITALSTPIITNVKLFYEDDEALLNSGEIFGTKFLEILRQGKPGVIRFLDWGLTNNGNITTWVTRKPRTYYSYQADEYRSALDVGTIVPTGVKYSATLASGAPSDKQTIHASFDAQEVTISIGADATVTFPLAHGMLVGQPFKFVAANGTSYPTGITPANPGDENAQEVYWVTEVVSSTVIRFSATKGGANVTTSGSASGTPKAFATPIAQTVTMSNANPAVVTWANHGLSIGDIVSINGTSSFGMPTPLYNQQFFYVLASGFTTGSFQFSLTSGGIAIRTDGFAVTGCQSGTNQPTVTIPGHNFTGGFVTFSGLGGISGINGETCAIISTSTDSIVVQIPNGGSTSGTYTSGGTALPSIGAKVEPDGSITLNAPIQAFGTCTLNLNGTGEVPIAAPWGDAAENISAPTATKTGTLVYDAGLARWLKFGGDVGGNAGLVNAVPPEVMVELCTRVGAHPYFCANFLALDPMTDLTTELASYVKNSGPAWMIPRFEGPNETWNPNLGFYATRYSWIKAPANWGAAYNFDQHNWYGKVLSTIGQAVSTVYSNNRARYEVVCGVQTDQRGSSEYNPRMTSAAYAAQAAAAQTGYDKSAASDWTTAVAVANYWSPGARDTAQEATWAADYAAAAGNSALQASIAFDYIATANDNGVGDHTFNLVNLKSMYVDWVTWMGGYSITKLHGYEGGYSPDYGGDAAINNLRRAGKNASNMEQYALQVYTDFADAGGTFPSCYIISAPAWAVWGVWDPDIYVSTIPPQWAAIAAFNA
jgi:hypothetical protein